MERNMSSEKRIVRDISWLSFNERVLQEAQDKSVSLHDRLKFLGIYSNNMDEFFRVRVATLARMAKHKKIVRTYLEDKPDKVLKQIHERVLQTQRKFTTYYNRIIRELRNENIFIINEKKLTSGDRNWIENYFNKSIRSNIVPLMIESIPAIPNLKDKSIYLACILHNSKNSFSKRYALIEVPTSILPRFVILPTRKGEKRIILLEDIIRYCLPNLFSQFGYDKYESYTIKLTRDAELDLDNDIDTTYIESIEKGLKNRKSGRALRFVYDKTIDKQLLDYLSHLLNLGKQDHFIPGGRVHNFKDFMSFPKEVFAEKKVKRNQFTHPLLKQPTRIMHVLDKQDVLLHVPYHSFNSIIDLLREAAIDPEVTDIKISCYRLAEQSKVVNALINAIRNGKKVTAVIELRARFNEKDNLGWKRVLEEVGAKVLIGKPHMKIHAKICVITKKVESRYKRYAFIGTGNINEATAGLYSDHFLLTSHKGICNDVFKVFQLIADPKSVYLKNELKHLVISPSHTREFFINKIKNEVKAGRNGELMIKLNSWSDEKLIKHIENAARQGVKVRLIIRGICRINTVDKNYQRKMEAVSIVDEYLEHSRIMYFKQDDSVYISSSDWMKRNLDHRIEVTTPIYDTKLKTELRTFMQIQLADNVKSRLLDNAQRNIYKKKKRKVKLVRSQEAVYDYLITQSYK